MREDNFLLSDDHATPPKKKRMNVSETNSEYSVRNTGHADCPRPITYFTWDWILCTTKWKQYKSLVNVRKQYNTYTILTLEFTVPIMRRLSALKIVSFPLVS